MRKKVFSFLLVLLITFMSVAIIGCSKVDEKTQKFADIYNDIYIHSIICEKKIEVIKSVKFDRKSKNLASIEFLQIKQDRDNCYAILGYLRQHKLYLKAKDAGILLKEDIRSKSIPDLRKDYKALEDKLGTPSERQKIMVELFGSEQPSQAYNNSKTEDNFKSNKKQEKVSKSSNDLKKYANSYNKTYATIVLGEKKEVVLLKMLSNSSKEESKIIESKLQKIYSLQNELHKLLDSYTKDSSYGIAEQEGLLLKKEELTNKSIEEIENIIRNLK